MLNRRFILFALIASLVSAREPNVILILTDDQGYGDLEAHGNPWLKTPEIDRLHRESVRFEDMHVMQFCTPTRASLMTGRYATRTGAYRTSSGRSMLHEDEVTMAEVFRDNGYATGIFGKWHLGDNYPHRPQDRGFEETLWHRCGGVGQISDYWGNDYFDDVYERNGTFEQFDGYCTDVWFQGALGFIEQKAKTDEPFFAYIATNAPHSPFRVDESYAAPYKAEAQWRKGDAAKFYGMIANIDENVGLLRRKLKEWAIEDNTILIFMTDNGTAGGVEMDTDALETEGAGYNAGMRGRKASVYDGGHRVPCFFYWPGGGLSEGRAIEELVAGYDILPTLIDLCEMQEPDVAFDGRSLGPLLRRDGNWPERILTLQYQGGNGFTYVPEIWTDSAVMTEQWRLIDGVKLFDIEQDPSQSHNVAAQHPRVLARLRAHYESWWDDVSPRMNPVRVHLGNAAENPVILSAQDWYLPVGNPPLKLNSQPTQSGPWMIEVEQTGLYRIRLSRFPLEADQVLKAQSAELRIGDQREHKKVTPLSHSIDFLMKLSEGETQIEGLLTWEDGTKGGAQFASIELLQK